MIIWKLKIEFPVKIQMSTNQYSNVYLTVISGTAIVALILFVCKLIKKLPPINWIGTNSLVILCTHLSPDKGSLDDVGI